MAIIDVSIATTRLSKDPVSLVGENQLLENLQVIFLLVMLVRYIGVARQLQGYLKAMFFGAAVGVVGCLFREIEFDPDGPYGWLDWLLRVPGRICAVTLGLPVVIWATRAVRHRPGAIPRMAFTTGWGRLGCLGLVLLVIAAGIDQRLFNEKGAMGWEEALESLAYCLLAASSFIPLKLIWACEFPQSAHHRR